LPTVDLDSNKQSAELCVTDFAYASYSYLSLSGLM